MAIGTPTNILSAAATSTTSSTTITASTNVAVPAGALIVAFVANRLVNTTTLSSFSDGTSNTYSVVANTPNTLRGVGIAYCYTTAGLASSSTLTGTLGLAASRKVLDAFYVTGIDASPLDKTATAEGATGNPDTGASAATTQAVEIVFGAFSHNAGAATNTGTPSGSYTQLTNAIAGSSNWCQGYLEYLIVSTTGTQDAAFTPTATTNGWSAVLATFKGSQSLVYPQLSSGKRSVLAR